MRNYRINLDEVEYDENLTIDVVVEVSTTPVPYTRATYDSPAEGGFFEDITIVKILECTDQNGKDILYPRWRSPSLLDVLIKTLNNAIDNQNDDVQRQLTEEDESRREAAEEDRADAQREEDWYKE